MNPREGRFATQRSGMEHVPREAEGALRALSDEQLALRAQGQGPRCPALRVLLARCQPWVAKQIRVWSWRCRLPRHLQDDARQEALLGVLEAVRRYDPGDPAGPPRCFRG